MISQLGWLNERLFVAIVDAVINLSLLAICTSYLWYEMATPGWREWRSNKLALGIWCHMFGLSLRTTWGAVLLWLFARGYDIGPVEDAYPLAFLGGMISAAGVLCKIRVLSPEGMGRERWLWIAVMFIAAVSGALGVSTVNLR